MAANIRSRDPAALDAWLVEQWSSMSSEVSCVESQATELHSDSGPVYPASKLYAVADYIMRDAKGRISKKSAMETLGMIQHYQDNASRGV